MNFKQIISTLLLVATLQGFAQKNVFLKRDFWSSNPSIQKIDSYIQEGQDIAEANSNNFDAVVYAILQNAPFETLQYIQSKPGNDVNKLTHDGRTYIFWAAYKGNTEFMKYLIKKGANTNITDDKGNTILNFAAGAGQTNTEVYDICIAAGANLEKDLTPYGANALLLVAPYDNNFELISYFTKKGLDINSVDANGNDVFNYVAKTGNKELLNKLKNKGVTGNDQAFLFAATGTRSHTNSLDVYAYLKSLGFNPNVTSKTGETPLHILAARSENLEILNFFINNNVPVNKADKNGNTAFINAASSNNMEVVSMLKGHVDDINTVNKKGQSALTVAVKGNSSEVVEFLIKNNANVKVIDAKGNSLVTYAIASYNAKKKEDFEKKIALLKANDIEISRAQKDGNTLYHLAVQTHDLDLVKWANTYKIDVNAKNNEGNTALHLAAMSAKNTDILKYLMSIGAKTSVTTDFDETVFDLASENELLKASETNLDFLK
ncbi:ankyrin repeat domain-containing protein [Bizionia sp. KMM 8389]